MSSEKSLTPQIRFKGFTEAWEQRKLSQIVSINGGKDYKYLEAGPIAVYGTGGYMTSVSQALSYNQDAIGIGRKGTIDCPYILKSPFWTIDTLFYSIPINNADLQFTLCLFLNVNWKSKDESTGLPSLSKQTIEKTLVKTPNALEQQKIGLIFSRLNSLITLHQRKLDALKKIKSALLEKMFPKNGSNVPEIRFTGFTEAWEQRKLGDLSKILGGFAWSSKEYTPKGEFLVITISNVTGDYFIDDSIGNRINLEKESNYILGSGDILVSLTGNVGRVSKMGPSKGVLNQRVAKMIPSKKIEIEFLFQLMRDTKFELKMIESGQGAAQKNISNNNILSYSTNIPNISEQRRIGHTFKKIDSLITLHQRKLDALKKIKSALLEKMFV